MCTNCQEVPFALDPGWNLTPLDVQAIRDIVQRTNSDIEVVMARFARGQIGFSETRSNT
jgi:hypothetical protein